MLARSGKVPTSGEWAFEVKWDGFRALVSRDGDLRVRTRWGTDLTELVPELEEIPVPALLDGELVAFNEDGKPSFPHTQSRLLRGGVNVPILFVVFDLLALDGEHTMLLPYRKRRKLLESLDLNGSAVFTPAYFTDGEALFEATCRQELEGIVCKKLSERYWPGERRWIKVKNRAYWRYPEEVGLAREWRELRRERYGPRLY